MTLHPTIAEVLATLPPPPPGPLDPAVLREGETHGIVPLADRLPLHSVDDDLASARGSRVPVRVYRPASSGSRGIIVYFHGGAFFLGSLETHDHVARGLAAASGFTVVSVDYRLAPESRFPAGLEDSFTAVLWAAMNDSALAFAGCPIAVAGDSSGANFAAAVAAMALDEGFDRITHQVLLYPSVDLDFDTDRYASLVENAVGNGLETAGLKPFNAFYIESGADPANPLVSPIKRSDLSGLPPALIITAEHDPLRDEGELYGHRLSSAGVETVVTRYAGAPHGFVQHFSWIPEYHAAFDDVTAFLNR